MTEAAFLLDITENPEDDTPRLVYADWLDDQGQSDRAEFIRAQVALVGMDSADPRWAGLKQRVEELAPQEMARWEADIAGRCSVFSICSRGLPASFDFSGDQFPKHAAAIAAIAPLQWVSFTNIRETVEAVANSPALARVMCLSLNNHAALGAIGLATLFGSPHWDNLSRLRFFTLDIDPVAARALVKARMPRLRHLSFESRQLSAPILGILANESFLGRLRSLRMSYSQLTAEGIQLLAGSPGLASITDLNLHGNRTLTAEGLLPLAESSYLHNLQRLELSQTALNGMDDVGVALARSSRLPHLKALELGQSWAVDTGGRHCFTDRTATAFASAQMPELTSLVIGDNRITAEGLTALGRSTTLSRLERLQLYHGEQFTGEALAALGQGTGLPGLTRLELPWAGLACVPTNTRPAGPGDLEGFTRFIRSKLVRQLRWLDLNGTALGAPGVEALAQSPAVAGLISLDLSDVQLDDAGFRALVRSRHLTGLRALKLSDVLGEESAIALLESPSLANLVFLSVMLRSPGPEVMARLQARFGPGLQCRTA